MTNAEQRDVATLKQAYEQVLETMTKQQDLLATAELPSGHYVDLGEPVQQLRSATF